MSKIRKIKNVLAIVVLFAVAAIMGCAYDPPTIGEELWLPAKDAGEQPEASAPASSDEPSQDAGGVATADAASDAKVDVKADASVDASIDASVDCGNDAAVDAAVDSGNDSGLAADGSGLFRLVVSPGGGIHKYTVFFNTLTGRVGEPTWGSPTYTQYGFVFDQSVKAFPDSVFITQGYWDPAFAGDWTRQMCDPVAMTLAVSVKGYFQGQSLSVTVASNGQGGCNLIFKMPLIK